jgi:hypothetical protein
VTTNSHALSSLFDPAFSQKCRIFIFFPIANSHLKLFCCTSVLPFRRHCFPSRVTISIIFSIWYTIFDLIQFISDFTFELRGEKVLVNQDIRVASFRSHILQISTWFSYYLFECNSIICFRLKTFDLFYNLGKKFWQEMNIYGVLLNIKSLQIKSKNSINLPLNRCISLFWSFCSVSSLSTLDLRRSKPC